MGIFSKTKNEKELMLVFDIGSSSIGGIFFEVQKLGVPKIILSVREPILLEEKVDINHFLSITLKSLDIVAEKISKSGIGKPSKIFCILSSPWYASQTRVIKLEKNTSFIFNSKIADELIKKEISLFEEEHLNKFSETDDKVRLIEFKNIKTMLNGYVSTSPFEKKAKKIEIMIFVSMSSEKILKKIENTIFKHFHTFDIKFSSFVLSSFAVVRDMFVDQDNFLLVDIGGEVTDISIIKKDILSNSISYPLGCNFMVRDIANTFKVSLSEAKSFFSLYRNGHAIEKLEKKLDPVITELKLKWLKGFQESLISISDDILIPSTIFITVDGILTDFFFEIIKNEQFNQYTLTESNFKIIFLNSKMLNNVAVFQNDVERDSILTIESIYINRFIC